MPAPTLKINHSAHGPGTGDAVVLLHGFPLDHRMWDAQAELLERNGFRVFLFDLPGMGSSPVPPAPPTLSQIAAAVVEAMHRAAVETFHLVGFSLGGYVALQLVLDSPDHVKSLALVGAKAEGDTPEGKKGRLETIAKVRASGMQVLVDAMMPKFFTARTHEQNPSLVANVTQTILKNPSGGAVRALKTMMERPDQGANLGRINCPTLIVVGAEDKLTPVDAARVLQQGIKGSQLRIVTGAAHLVPLEAEGPFNHFLEDFLKGSLKPLSLGGAAFRKT